MPGHVTETLHAGRILSKGEITSLSQEFSLPQNVPFSLFLPRTASTASIEVINCKLYQETAPGPCPVNVGGWTEPLLLSLPASNAGLLTNYRLFWGAGQSVNL